MLRVGSDPADVVRDVGKFFVSESFRVCLRRTHERARNTLMNYDRDERKNGTSMKIFSGNEEREHLTPQVSWLCNLALIRRKQLPVVVVQRRTAQERFGRCRKANWAPQQFWLTHRALPSLHFQFLLFVSFTFLFLWENFCAFCAGL